MEILVNTHQQKESKLIFYVHESLEEMEVIEKVLDSGADRPVRPPNSTDLNSVTVAIFCLCITVFLFCFLCFVLQLCSLCVSETLK